MKNKLIILLLASVTMVSCKKWLDINSDPDTPQNPDPLSVFPTLLSNIPGGGGERGTGGVQSDALWIGSYIQFWQSRSNDASVIAQADWDKLGYNGFTADRAAGIWRLTYFGCGKGLEYCINEGMKRGQWDVVGATLALKAYLFQMTTNYHGDIIFKDAFKEDSLYFKWDDQSVVYKGVDSLCRLAIDYLSRGDYPTTATRLSVRGDFVYNGDVAKWKKFAYGILARNFSAPIYKTNYSADSVIKYADLGPNTSAGGADDFVIPFDATRNADANWFGTYRDNVTNLRQSDYIVRLLDGRVFNGGVTTPATRDPRMRHMISKSVDTTNGNGGYNGIVPNVTNPTGNTAVPTLWGEGIFSNPGSGNFSISAGRYLFQNKVVFPIMTYSEMQFLKAEAAMRKNDRATAYTAYRNGIQGHFNFINRTSFPRSNSVLYSLSQITAAEQTAYLASSSVKQTAAALTLGDVMQQKFIALWGWGFVETWTDLRKYHYIDVDPTSPASDKVYSGWNLPNTIFADNNGKFPYRVRPRYNSEYVWNIYVPAVARTTDYHTIPTWFSLP